jgi:hypothetical protein
MRIAALAMMIAVYPVWGQIAQSHPEFCGFPGNVNPPLADISATIGEPDEHIMLRVGQGNSAPVIALPGYFITEVSQICLLPAGRLVVFGTFYHAENTADTTVVDMSKATVADHFVAYAPVSISPDQRWIAYVKFWPLHGSEGSDEIMLYDLTKSAAENRADHLAGHSTDPGRMIFPPGHENSPAAI